MKKMLKAFKSLKYRTRIRIHNHIPGTKKILTGKISLLICKSDFETRII